jgi:hypothetical protein
VGFVAVSGFICLAITPVPSKSHQIFTKGNGLDREEVKVHAQDEEKFVDMHHFDHVDHGTDFQEAPPPVYSQVSLTDLCTNVGADRN